MYNQHISSHIGRLLVSIGIAIMAVPSSHLSDSHDDGRCMRPTIAGDDDPWASKHGRDIRTNANRMYIMQIGAHSSSCCGQVTKWKYQASVRAHVRPITFMVWRRVVSETNNDMLQLIGQSSHWYMKGKSRTVVIQLESEGLMGDKDSDDNDGRDDDKSILVQRGDFLGWHTHKGDVIAYSPSPHAMTQSPVAMWDMDVTSIPIGWKMQLSQGKALDRVYGLQAVIEPVPVPEFFHPPHRLPVKCPLPASSYVTTIHTTRPLSMDHGDEATFHVYGYNPWFTINATSGEVSTLITIAGNVTHEVTIAAQNVCGSRSYISFSIQCIDIASTPRECRETKPPQKVNKAPVISFPVSLTVPEDQPGGSHLFFISVHDEDTSIDEVSVSIVCVSRSGHLFHIDNNEGAVYLKSNETLDYESTDQHVFVARAFDGYNYSIPASIKVFVTDVNEPPSPTHDKLRIDSFAIEEGSVLVKDLRSLFHDPEDQSLTFHLNQNESYSIKRTFAIDSGLGAIILTRYFKVQRHDSPATILLELVASDGTLSGHLDIELRMFHDNSKPSVVNLPANITVTEDEFSVADVVFTLVIHDEDVGDNIRIDWSLQGGRQGMDGPMFAVNKTDGRVILLYIPPMSLGQESTSEITVRAYDGHVYSDVSVLRILIIGQNEAPRFLMDNFHIVINESQIGNPVFGLEENTVIDPDPRDVMSTLTLDIVEYAEQYTADLQIVFYTSNGHMLIQPGYDIDLPGNPSVLHINIKVTDIGGLSDTASLEVVITDENDNAPLVENDGEIFHTPQSVYPGLRIGQIKATDKDSGQNGMLSFQVIGSNLNETSEYFAIASTSGWLISTGQTPPVEWTSLYIAVSDRGFSPLITMATVNIIAPPQRNSSSTFTSTPEYAIKNTTTVSNVNKNDNDNVDDGDADINDDGRGEELAEHFKLKTTKQGTLTNVNVKSTPERKAAILILVAISCLLSAVVVVLGYNLWKAKKLLRYIKYTCKTSARHKRRFQRERSPSVDMNYETNYIARMTADQPSVHHEYRFPWIPGQVNGEDSPPPSDNPPDNFASCNSVTNPNFRYLPVSQHDVSANHIQSQDSSTVHRENTLVGQPDSYFNDKTLTTVSLFEEEAGSYQPNNYNSSSTSATHFKGTTETTCINGGDTSNQISNDFFPSSNIPTNNPFGSDWQIEKNSQGGKISVNDEQLTPF